MKLRFRFESGKDGSPSLTGWQRVIAVAIVGGVIVVAVCFTPPETVAAVVDPLLRILGVSAP
jgi:hypothetical protein